MVFALMQFLSGRQRNKHALESRTTDRLEQDDYEKKVQTGWYAHIEKRKLYSSFTAWAFYKYFK